MPGHRCQPHYANGYMPGMLPADCHKMSVCVCVCVSVSRCGPGSSERCRLVTSCSSQGTHFAVVCVCVFVCLRTAPGSHDSHQVTHFSSLLSLQLLLSDAHTHTLTHTHTHTHSHSQAMLHSRQG